MAIDETAHGVTPEKWARLRAKTNDQGQFQFDSVPLLPYRFTIGAGRATIRSDPMPFRQSGERQVVLVYRALDAVLDWKPAPETR